MRFLVVSGIAKNFIKQIVQYIYSNMLRKVALSTFLVALALYIFLPTPDQLVIFPAGSLFLSYAFHISIVYAVLLVSLFYYGAGTVALIGALLIGGRPIYCSFRERFRKRKMQPVLKRLGSV